MSDLGSIYGTTVDGSNTLVIDFSNVDICGNLNINGGLAIDNSFGSDGQILISKGNGAAPKWKFPQKAHGHATYMTTDNPPALQTNFNNLNGSTNVAFPSVRSVDSGAPTNFTTLFDAGYTSIHGMSTTYIPVDISFIPSTTPLITGVGQVFFPHNPTVSGVQLTPSRWRIQKAGHYKIHVAVRIQDSLTVSWTSLCLWQRTGGTAQLPGAIVNVIGVSESRCNFGDNQYGQQSMGTVVSIDGIYLLSQFDEIYCSLNADSSNGGYAAHIGTYINIQEI
jgi:hypothetical protein